MLTHSSAQWWQNVSDDREDVECQEAGDRREVLVRDEEVLVGDLDVWNWSRQMKLVFKLNTCLMRQPSSYKWYQVLGQVVPGLR